MDKVYLGVGWGLGGEVGDAALKAVVHDGGVEAHELLSLDPKICI